MRFDLTKPCDNCPFRTDCLPGWLGEERAQAIADSILSFGKPGKTVGAQFPCHKTTEATGASGDNPQHCAGAMILLRKRGEPNTPMQLAERFGMFNPADLRLDAPVFDTPEEFVQHHAHGEM